MEIYGNDFKVLNENGYDSNSAVLIAFGQEEIKFVDENTSKFSTEKDENARKFMILMKEGNESPASLRILTPTNDEEQKVFLEIIKRLYKNGTFDANTASAGESLFKAATSHGSIWVLEKLLEMGAKYDSASSKESTFQFAHQIETVKWIHKKFKVDLLKFMTEGDGLFTIASSGNFEIFDYIMSEIKRSEGDEHVQEIFNRKTDYHGQNVLMQATNALKFDFVVKCLKYEPDLIFIDSSSCNLLHIALKTYPISRELVNVLINKQPILLLMEDSNQWTPMHFLMNLNYLDELKQIYQNFPSYKNSLFKSFCDTPTIEKEMMNVWNETPGHGAFNPSHLEMAKFIIENHPEEFDSSEYISGLLNVLTYETDSVDAVKVLQKLKFFNVNVPDKNKVFPLFAALAHKKLNMYRYMLESCDVKDLNLMVDPHTKKNLLYPAILNNPVDVIAVPYNHIECTTMTHDIDSSGDESEKVCPPTFSEPFVEPPKIDRKEMFDIFMNLVNCGANFGHKAGKLSLLYEAVDNDNLEVVQELLRLGLSVEDCGENDETPLHVVKSVEVFKALIEKVTNSEFINIKNAQGHTAFMCFASLYGFSSVPIELFKEFMNHKADVKAADNNGFQPIHAVNTVEWIKLLLHNGADINAVNNEQENAAHLALRNRNWKLAKYLLNQKEIDLYAVTTNGTSYITHITSGDSNYLEIFDGKLKKVFEELVEKHINEKIDYGLLINSFIRDGNLKLVQNPKADLHLREADGQTCLHRAIVFKTNLDVVKYLIDSGLDLNAVTEYGYTPLMMCFDNHCSEIAEFLINQEKIDLNLTDTYGYSALHYAVRSDDIETLCKLLAAGADPKITNNDGKTFFDLLGDSDKNLFALYATKSLTQ